jgi:hypothetical protein
MSNTTNSSPVYRTLDTRWITRRDPLCMRWLTLPEYVSRAREANAEKEQRKNKEKARKETGNVAHETTTKL